MLPSPKVFITGASSGIGAALAAHYTRQGAVLGLCARRLAPTQALFSSLLCTGSCYQVDVTDAASLQAAAADFAERFGVPDIVIANAGISVGTSTENPEPRPTVEASSPCFPSRSCTNCISIQAALVATAASFTTNPLLLALILVVAGVVVSADVVAAPGSDHLPVLIRAHAAGG